MVLIARLPLLSVWLIALWGVFPTDQAAAQGGHWRLIDTTVHQAPSHQFPAYAVWTYSIAPGQASMEGRGGVHEITYRAEARWDSPPAILIPGQDVALNMSVTLSEWVFNEPGFGSGTNLNLNMSGRFRDATEPSDFFAPSLRWWQNLASIGVHTRPAQPGQRSESATAILVAPQPSAGHSLFGVLFGFGAGSAHGWNQVVHVYEWQPGPAAPEDPVDETATDCPTLIARGQVPNEFFGSDVLLAGGHEAAGLRFALTSYQQSLDLIATQLSNRQYGLAQSNLARLQQDAQLPVLLAEQRTQGRQISVLLRGLPSDAAMADLRRAEQALVDNRAAYDLLADMLEHTRAAMHSADRRFIRQVFVTMVRSYLSWSSLPDMRDLPETLLDWYTQALDEAAALSEGQSDLQRLQTLHRFLEGQRADVVARHPALLASVQDRADLAGIDAALRVYFGDVTWACWAPAVSDAPTAPAALAGPTSSSSLPALHMPAIPAPLPATDLPDPPSSQAEPPPPATADVPADKAEPQPGVVVVVTGRETLGPDMTRFRLSLRNPASEPVMVVALNAHAQRMPLGGGVVWTGGAGAQILAPGTARNLTLVATGDVGAIVLEIDLGEGGVVRHNLPVDHAATPDVNDSPEVAAPDVPTDHLITPQGFQIGAGDMVALTTPTGQGRSLHAGPGSAYPVLAHIAEGDAIEFQGVAGDWARVWHMASDNEGWVQHAFLEPPAQPGATALLVIDTALSDGLPLRAGPGSGHPELRRLFKGMVVDRLDTAGAWLQVLLTDGTTGWIPAAGARPLP